MSEFISSKNPEVEPVSNLMRLVEIYFPDDKEFVVEMDFDDALGFVYGQLIASGEDPDVVLRDFGVTEGDSE